MPQRSTTRLATITRRVLAALSALTRRNTVANTLQIAGAVALSAGVGLIFVPAGIITAGLCLLAFGLATELEGGDAR